MDPDAALWLTAQNRDAFQTVWPLNWGDLPPDSALPPAISQAKLRYPARLSGNFGSYPGGKIYPFGKPFEFFHGDWGSMRLSAEQGVANASVPPASSLELAYPLSSQVFFAARASLKRDIRAWHQDELGRNWPMKADEVDLNEPSLGYLTAQNDWGRFIFGRFPVHMGASPEFSLMLGGQKPWQDGALITLKTPLVRYHFFFASLNPWLQGSPQGKFSSDSVPVGSEAWQQTHYPNAWAENAHNRVYAARAKSLVIHRLEFHGSWRDYGITLGISEMQAIGGKVPDLYDIAPFMVWHNDFKYGYTNNLVQIDARLHFPYGITAFGELAMDDLPYAPKEGPKQHAILGTLLGLEERGASSRLSWVQRLHWIRTDPLLYRFLQPLNTLYARQTLSSNNQPASEATFIDRFVIDYPAGYVRGGDAEDIWYSGSGYFSPFSILSRGLFATVKAAYLQHGEINLDTPHQTINNATSPPSGRVLEEWRGELSAALPMSRGFTLRLGLGGSKWERADLGGEHFWGEAGLQWQWDARRP